jgi:hypothetical protein
MESGFFSTRLGRMKFSRAIPSSVIFIGFAVRETDRFPRYFE